MVGDPVVDGRDWTGSRVSSFVVGGDVAERLFLERDPES